jgi:hypothetical protein
MEFNANRLLGDLRPLMRREHRGNPAIAKDHNLFKILLGLSHQSDAACSLGVDLFADPLGPAARLAETTAC